MLVQKLIMPERKLERMKKLFLLRGQCTVSYTHLDVYKRQVQDLDEAIADGTPQLYGQFPGNIIERGCPPFGPKALQELVIGDTKKGFEECSVVVEGTSKYETISNPLPAESPGLVAW